MQTITDLREQLVLLQAKLTNLCDTHAVYRNCYANQGKDQAFLNYLESEIQSYNKKVMDAKKCIETATKQQPAPTEEVIDRVLDLHAKFCNEQAPHITDAIEYIQKLWNNE